MKFWDSSAIVPLIVAEASTKRMTSILEADPVMCAWWATETECVSALARLERDGAFSERAMLDALRRLDALSEAWNEVQPVAGLRRTARRLLRVHPLRSGDALQLAAAITAAEGVPASLEIVTLDERLGAAAQREGFSLRDGLESAT